MGAAAVIFVAGALACVFGLFVCFAGGMSDDPESGASVSKTGCIIAAIGAAGIIGGIVLIILHFVRG